MRRHRAASQTRCIRLPSDPPPQRRGAARSNELRATSDELNAKNRGADRLPLVPHHSLLMTHHCRYSLALISSTSRPRLWSSFTSTLKDSGSPGSRKGSPFTIASYIRERPGTSSDLTVRNSCRVEAAP